MGKSLQIFFCLHFVLQNMEKDMLFEVVELQHPKIIPLGKQDTSDLLDSEKLLERSFMLVEDRPADGIGRNRSGCKIVACG
jgi:hypothetical protein